MIRFTGNKSGFTLIEVIVAILLSTVVITVVYQVMTVSTKTNNVITEQTSAMSSLDATVDTIRQTVMPAKNLTIGDSSVEAVPEGADIIKCVDNVIYLNNNVIGSASLYAVNHIELKFSAQESGKVLRMELECYDENNGLLEGKTRQVDFFLQSLGENGEGKIKNSAEGTYKNCIVFSTMKPSD